MTQYIPKATLLADIKKRKKEWQYGSSIEAKYKKEECDDILSFIETLEVKNVVTEQEGVCNGIFNRIIGYNWNLSIPLDKVGLKHGDKVKIFVTKENKL